MPNLKHGAYLAFDFGLKKIGVAVIDSESGLGQALTILKTYKGHPDDWREITKLIEAWRPVGLVVGIPLNMDGTDQTITIKARGFAKTLAIQTGVMVHHADERLSTIEAKAQRFEVGGYKALESPLDAHAAHIIVTRWFLEQTFD